ncbi:Xaa-Pro aminopeptidase [Rhizobium leucaenae]|nr:Xaa-Pro aminopeptidase [Rhizobium leucaenae]
MDGETLRFELFEYKNRLEKARGAMEQAGIDLLVVTDPAIWAG